MLRMFLEKIIAYSLLKKQNISPSLLAQRPRKHQLQEIVNDNRLTLQLPRVESVTLQYCNRNHGLLKAVLFEMRFSIDLSYIAKAEKHHFEKEKVNVPTNTK